MQQKEKHLTDTDKAMEFDFQLTSLDVRIIFSLVEARGIHFTVRNKVRKMTTMSSTSRVTIRGDVP